MGEATFNRPYFVASATSGVDGASEGGRVSSIRQPDTLVLYAVPLLKQIQRAGYGGKLDAEPAIENGGWVLRVTYDGDRPDGVPATWSGRRVVLAPASASDG